MSMSPKEEIAAGIGETREQEGLGQADLKLNTFQIDWGNVKKSREILLRIAEQGNDGFAPPIMFQYSRTGNVPLKADMLGTLGAVLKGKEYDPAACALLRDQLGTNEYSLVRKAAAGGLGRIGGTAADLSSLRQAQDPNNETFAEVRAEAARAIELLLPRLTAVELNKN